MSSFITNRDIPIFVTIPVIFLASKKKFRTEWENGCQKFRTERVKNSLIFINSKLPGASNCINIHSCATLTFLNFNI